jgi:hypothetical protein
MALPSSRKHHADEAHAVYNTCDEKITVQQCAAEVLVPTHPKPDHAKEGAATASVRTRADADYPL